MISTETNKVGIVVGAAPMGDERLRLQKLLENRNDAGVDFVIAADGGIEFFLDAGISPDMWIGDMDSADSELEDRADSEFLGLNKRTCSPIKDDTDMAIALKIVFDEQNCREAYVYGGLGGQRMDHSLANIQLLHHFKLLGKTVKMFGQGTEMFVLMDEKVSFDEKEEGYVSVFSLTDSAEVIIEGLYYEYSGILKNSYALGVSNEMCGKKAEICVKTGAALVTKTEKDI